MHIKTEFRSECILYDTQKISPLYFYLYTDYTDNTDFRTLLTIFVGLLSEISSCSYNQEADRAKTICLVQTTGTTLDQGDKRWGEGGGG